MTYRYALTVGYDHSAKGQMFATVSVEIPESINTPNGVALAFGAAGKLLHVHPSAMAIVNVVDLDTAPAPAPLLGPTVVYAVIRATRSHTETYGLYWDRRDAEQRCRVLNETYARGARYEVAPMRVQ